MAQWMNLHRNNSFVNWTQLPLLCEKIGAIHLVLVGLTAVRQAGRLAVRQNSGGFLKFLKFSTDRIVRIFAAFNKGTVLL